MKQTNKEKNIATWRIESRATHSIVQDLTTCLQSHLCNTVAFNSTYSIFISTYTTPLEVSEL